MPAVTPATISNATDASFSSCASSLPRPNTNGSPPLRRTTRFPSPAGRMRRAWITPAATTEHERIAALETNDALPFAREPDEKRIDLTLAHRFFRAATLPDVIQL